MDGVNLVVPFSGVFIVPIRTLGQQQKKVLEEAFPPVQFGPSKVGICQETSNENQCNLSFYLGRILEPFTTKMIRFVTTN